MESVSPEAGRFAADGWGSLDDEDSRDDGAPESGGF